jgi:hypothetical protein
LTIAILRTKTHAGAKNRLLLNRITKAHGQIENLVKTNKSKYTKNRLEYKEHGKSIA